MAGMGDLEVIEVPLRRFLTFIDCPPEWQGCDLYLFRSEEVVFYVGQSHSAFTRIWEHLKDGFKGRSLVGRFVLMNWPHALNFTVTLICSTSAHFAGVENRVDAAERLLIEKWSPCFNEVFNPAPSPLPEQYNPPTAKVRHPRSLRQMMREAEYANRLAERRHPW